MGCLRQQRPWLPPSPAFPASPGTGSAPLSSWLWGKVPGLGSLTHSPPCGHLHDETPALLGTTAPWDRVGKAPNLGAESGSFIVLLRSRLFHLLDRIYLLIIYVFMYFSLSWFRIRVGELRENRILWGKASLNALSARQDSKQISWESCCENIIHRVQRRPEECESVLLHDLLRHGKYMKLHKLQWARSRIYWTYLSMFLVFEC